MNPRLKKTFIIYTVGYVIVTIIIISYFLSISSPDETPDFLLDELKEAQQIFPIILIIIIIASYFLGLSRILIREGIRDDKKLQKTIKDEYKKLTSFEKEKYKEGKRRTLKVLFQL